jgi:hypothetical protein
MVCSMADIFFVVLSWKGRGNNMWEYMERDKGTKWIKDKTKERDKGEDKSEIIHQWISICFSTRLLITVTVLRNKQSEMEQHEFGLECGFQTEQIVLIHARARECNTKLTPMALSEDLSDTKERTFYPQRFLKVCSHAGLLTNNESLSDDVLRRNTSVNLLLDIWRTKHSTVQEYFRPGFPRIFMATHKSDWLVATHPFVGTWSLDLRSQVVIGFII